MSLINQMLQDLETRRAEGAGRAALSGEVRPLPPEPPPAWVRMALGVVVAGLLTAGGLLWLRSREAPPPAPMLAPRMQSAPVAAAQADPRASPAPAQEMQPPAPAASQPAATPAPLPIAPAQVAAPVAEKPAEPAQPAQVAKQKPSPARAEQAKPGREGRLKVATSLSLSGETSAKETAHAGEGASSIEKQIRTPSARDRAEAEYRKASGLLNQGRLNEAMAGFRAAMHEDPGHANARLTLLGILVEQKKFDEAQTLAQEGLALNPAQPQMAMRLARIQVERGDVHGAADTLQKASSAAGNNAEYRGFRAAVLQRLTLHKEAAEEYQAALRLAPQSGVWWMGLGISLEADGRAAEAREAYQRAKTTGSLSAELNGFVDGKLRQLQ